MWLSHHAAGPALLHHVIGSLLHACMRACVRTACMGLYCMGRGVGRGRAPGDAQPPTPSAARRRCRQQGPHRKRVWLLVKAPLPPQVVLLQLRGGARGRAVEAAVRAHDALHARLLHARAEGGQVRLLQVPFGRGGEGGRPAVWRRTTHGPWMDSGWRRVKMDARQEAGVGGGGQKATPSGGGGGGGEGTRPA